MTIDQQLRAALSQEAEMQTVPPPDVDRLIIGGKVRQRRRNVARVAWVGVTAAVAVLVAGAVYGVVKTGSGNAVGPAGSPSPTTSHAYQDNHATIQLGTYRMHVGVDDADVPIYADLTFDDRADGFTDNSDNYPVLSDAHSNGGVAVYRPVGISAGTGCLVENKLTTNVGDTPQTLAQQLAGLPQSTVLQPPTSVQTLGRNAVHLQLRIANDCGADVYRVAETVLGGHGISYDPIEPVVIDFWVMNVAGVPVVVETWHGVGATGQLVNELARVKDSVTFVTGG